LRKEATDEAAASEAGTEVKAVREIVTETGTQTETVWGIATGIGIATWMGRVIAAASEAGTEAVSVAMTRTASRNRSDPGAGTAPSGV
jgi:hypothetical protein